MFRFITLLALFLTRAAHLPGRHNQLTHGRSKRHSAVVKEVDRMNPRDRSEPAAIKALKAAVARKRAAAREPMSADEATRWAEDAAPKWQNSLSPDEQDAMKRYKMQNGDFGIVNYDLRNRLDPRPHVQPRIDAMDRAIEKAPPLERPAAVYRGGLPDSILDAFARGEEGGLPGQVFGDKAFLSTSLDKGVAEEFQGGGRAPSLGRILLPAGTKAAYLEPFDEEELGEQEMLLPRNSRLRITDAYVKDDNLWVDAELLPPDGA